MDEERAVGVPARLSRRAVLAAAGGLFATAACEAGRRAVPVPPSTTAAPTARGFAPPVVVPAAAGTLGMAVSPTVQAENARPGTLAWVPTGVQVDHGIEGYPDRASAVAGEQVSLAVSTQAPQFIVEIYRLGWYGGAGARLVGTSPELMGWRFAVPAADPVTHMVECAWPVAWRFMIGADWISGSYLCKLVGSGGQQSYVPFTVRDDTSAAAYLVQSSVTTWQAYNRWGGYSLYLGRSGAAGASFAERARVVSFDRPYERSTAYGASDLIGLEYPLIRLLERHGADVTYWTDIDLHQQPGRLVRHRALLSLAHDEYWSSAMYDGALAARDASVNIAFFGANAVYRHIRLEPGVNGEDRRQACYKVAQQDPLYGHDDAEVTADWDSGPVPRPEGALIGASYASSPVDAALRPVPDHWVWRGTGVSSATALAHAVGSEFDHWDPTVKGVPLQTDVVAHSPLTVAGRHDHSDATWYTTRQGAGVFAAGTNYWIPRLCDMPPGALRTLLPGPVPGVTDVLQQATLNVLAVLGAGPAGVTHPSHGTWRDHYAASGEPLPR